MNAPYTEKGKLAAMHEASFEESISITRPANTTQYAVNDVINGNGETEFAEVDLSTNVYVVEKAKCGVTSQKCVIEEIELFSSNGAAVIKLAPIIQIYNAATISGSTLTDNTAYDPTYAQVIAKLINTVNSDEFNQSIDFGTNVYKLAANEINRKITLPSTNIFYVGIFAGNTYTPASTEQLKLIVKGKIL